MELKLLPFSMENPKITVDTQQNITIKKKLETDLNNFPDYFFSLSLNRTRSFRQFNKEIADEYSYTALLKNEIPGLYLGQILNILQSLFDCVLNEIKTVYSDNDWVRIFIIHEEMSYVNIVVGPMYVSQMTSEEIMKVIGRVISSNNFIPADKKLRINVAAVRNLTGTNHLCITNVWEDLTRKTSIIKISNTDNMCLPRSIVVAVARLKSYNDKPNMEKHKIYRKILKGEQGKKGKKKYNSSSYQKVKATELMRMAGIPVQKEGFLEDIPKYEKVLQVGISVISARGGNKKVHMANTTFKDRVHLYHIPHETCGGGHFAVITKLNAIAGRSYYCEDCEVGYNTKGGHRCKVTCNICRTLGCLELGEKVYCKKCHAPCRSANCLQRHQAEDICSRMSFCPTCYVNLRGVSKMVRDSGKHACGETFCKNCQMYYMHEHNCFMRSTPKKKAQFSSFPKRFVFYDFESMVGDDGEHIPNLVVAHSICEKCSDETHVSENTTCDLCGSRCPKCCKFNKKVTDFAIPPCVGCGKREVIFRGENTANLFCQWLIQAQHKNVVALAHNSKGYDSYFIYKYLIDNSIQPQIIFQGSKIMYCNIASGLSITLLDSLNFLPMALAQLPKSFDIGELKKGFFPHLFNTPNRNTNVDCTAFPKAEMYDPENMSCSKRAEFLKWYEINKHKQFHFNKELLEYCRSDVNILLTACWKFRALVDTVTDGIDCFEYLTIASLCMGIFRTKFLEERWKVLLLENALGSCDHEWNCKCVWSEARKPDGDSKLEVQILDKWLEASECAIVESRFVSSPVALPPPHGYAKKEMFSKQALQWLALFEQQHPEKIKLQTAKSAEGEKKVWYERSGRQHHYKLDGYYKDKKDQIMHALEFNGCYYHGCPRCYPRERDITMVRGKTLTARYSDTIMKERTLRNLGYKVHTMWSCDFTRGTESGLMPELEEIEDAINLRDCYFGGRTNALVLHKECKERERCGYCDFCSLYPYALKYFSYPLGHPTRLVDNFKECQTAANGFKMFPYFGVVKMKVLPPQNQLHPILPFRCNGKLMFPLCRTCATLEEKGDCRCSDEERCFTGTWCTPEVEEALNCGYEILKLYEVLHWDTTSDQLFTRYINTFLKIKAEASGYPSHLDTSEGKLEYIENYRKHEGVSLERGKIEKNSGLRSLAKLALNSFYGKFGQRQNMKKCQFVTDAGIMYSLLSDPTKKISDFHIVSQDMMVFEYTRAQEFESTDPKTNVIVAAFCTSYARLHLWKVMRDIGARVLYHDTDSVIYSYLPSEYRPTHGEYLGELTNELDCREVGCKGCHDGHWISEFVSCGPKNYAYRLNTGQVVCKVRGFSLNFSASQILNFESMKKALQNWTDGVEDEHQLATISTQFLRNKLQPKIITKKMKKKYNVVYNKRRVVENLQTVPYGYSYSASPQA